MSAVHDADGYQEGAERKLMAKIKNDPAHYQKRAVSAPKAQAVAGAVNKSSLFFTAPLNGHYLDFRSTAAPKPKRTASR